jgi:membrane associated rhomboid family serine protease
VVIAIIIITSLISIYAFTNQAIFDKFRFNAYFIKHNKEGWRFLTYGFLHANWVHLVINMFVFYSFGKTVLGMYMAYFEMKAYIYFILLYIGGIVFSVLVDFGKNKDNIYYNAVGASGAVSAIVFASIILYPAGKIMLFPIPFPIPSVIFGILYLVYSAYMARKGTGNIGHSAHFWGAVFGIAFTVALKPAIITIFWEQIRMLF